MAYLRSYDLKKPRSNFVVEYKGARRKLQSKPKSIWGEVDLNSYADGVDDASSMNGASNGQGSPTADGEPDDKVRGRDNARDKAAYETSVTDEPPQDLNVKAAIPTAAKAVSRTESNKLQLDPVVPTAEGAAHESLQPVDEPSKRGRTRPVNRMDRASDIAPVRTKASTRKPATARLDDLESMTAAGDEMDDLRQLELENARLRKLLGEKLRSENAFLRRRLGRA